MKKNNFILYTLVYLVIACLLVFKMGPTILKAGKAIETKPQKIKNIKKIYFWYHVASNDYLNVNIDTKEKEIQFQFFIPEDNHMPLFNMLIDNGLINNNSSFLDSVPISFDKEKLLFIDTLEVIFTKDKLTYVGINNKTIKGSKSTVRKPIVIFLGYFIITIGILGLVFLPLGLYWQIKDNKQYGKPIYVPNKLKGIKSFFKIFRK